MVRRLLRTKKPKNPEPRFRFRNFHFGLASDPLHCRHIQEDSKEDTQDSGTESEKEKIHSLSLNNRRRLKKKRKRVILRIRRSLPRTCLKERLSRGRRNRLQSSRESWRPRVWSLGGRGRGGCPRGEWGRVHRENRRPGPGNTRLSLAKTLDILILSIVKLKEFFSSTGIS